MASLYQPPSLRKKKQRSSHTLPPTIINITRPISLQAILQENKQVTVQDPESIEFLSNTGSYGTLISIEKQETRDLSLSPPNKRKCYENESLLSHTLHLSHLEAFYLMHTSKMTITSFDLSTEISLSSLWQLSVTHNEYFIIKYIAYFKLRDQGWIVKCGLKFGVDFLLYKTNPSLCHSSYAVIVKTHLINDVGVSTESINSVGMSTESINSVGVSTESINSVGMSTESINSVGMSTDWLSWKQVVSLVRVNEGVAKELALCNVDVNSQWEGPGVWSEEKISEILKHSKVSFVIIKRHQPEKERET